MLYPSFWQRLALLAAVVVFLGFAVSAKADSITYDLSGTFSTGHKLSGSLVWDSSRDVITSYFLTLNSMNNSASCNSNQGTCTFVSDLFSGPKSSVFLFGVLNPKDTVFDLFVWAGGPLPRFSNANVCWTPMSVPEGPVGPGLLIVLAVLGIVISACPPLRVRARS